MSLTEVNTHSNTLPSDDLKMHEDLAVNRELIRHAATSGEPIDAKTVDTYIGALAVLFSSPHPAETQLPMTELIASRLSRQMACLLPETDDSTVTGAHEMVVRYLEQSIESDGDLLGTSKRLMRNFIEDCVTIVPFQ